MNKKTVKEILQQEPKTISQLLHQKLNIINSTTAVEGHPYTR